MASAAPDQGIDGRLPSRSCGNVRSEVAAHLPADEREAAARERILAALDTLQRPFDKDADPVHVTGSAVVVGPRGTVLHVHRRLGRWMQPGGHVDIGEGPSDAALRESQEETGLALSHPAGGPRLIHLDVHPAADGHTHLDLRYLLLGADADPSPPPGESPEVRWCTWEEADALSDAALTGALRAARRQPEAQQFLGEAGGVTTSESVNGATKHKSPDGWRTSQGPTRASSHESHGGAMGHNGG